MANGDLVIAVPVGKLSVEERPTPRILLPGTNYGAIKPFVDFDGSQGTYAARAMISQGDTAANTALAMTRLDLATEDNIRSLFAALSVGSGYAELRIAIDPGDDQAAQDALSRGYPDVEIVLPGERIVIPRPRAIATVYYVAVLAAGATLSACKGRATVQAVRPANAKSFADAPFSHLYRLHGTGSQAQVLRAGFPTQAATLSAASWSTEGRFVGNGAAYGTLPANFSGAVSGMGVGTKLIIAARMRNSGGAVSGKYALGIGRSSGGSGAASGCLSIQLSGSSVPGLNWRLAALNDTAHTSNDNNVSSAVSLLATDQVYAWLLDLNGVADTCQSYVDGVLKTTAYLAMPDLVNTLYPYYGSAGAIFGAQLTSGGATNPLPAGVEMDDLFVGRYPDMSLADAVELLEWISAYPGYYSELMQ